MTIKDLSAQTGYSVGTVSRVLNHQPNVSEKARNAILAAVKESGFQLNSNAKQLKQQHSNAILVIVKGTSNELFSNLVEAMQARIREDSYPLTVDYLDEEGNEVLRASQLCLEKKPLGVLFLGGNRQNFLDNFDKIGVPCVLVTNNGTGLPFPNLSSVSSDDRLSAANAINYLLSLGHRRIAVIGGDPDVSEISKLRFLGCMDAFQANGIPFNPDADYARVRFSFAGGYHGAQELLAREQDFTALFAMSDVMAIGAIRALADAGKSVPKDVSVIGFDGLAIGDYMLPKLSTIRQSVEELAQRSMEMLRENIDNPSSPRHETIPTTVEGKNSTRKI